jgi:predicted acyl esterase
MVQVQSSWFPLYDRNPQTFVPNIFFAKASDYRPATQKVFTGAGGSWIGLPLIK